jgi:hypothetical protein
MQIRGLEPIGTTRRFYWSLMNLSRVGMVILFHLFPQIQCINYI